MEKDQNSEAGRFFLQTVCLHTIATATAATFSSSAAGLANAAKSKRYLLNTFIEIMLRLSSWQQSILAFSDVETKKKKFNDSPIYIF